MIGKANTCFDFPKYYHIKRRHIVSLFSVSHASKRNQVYGIHRKEGRRETHTNRALADAVPGPRRVEDGLGDERAVDERPAPHRVDEVCDGVERGARGGRGRRLRLLLLLFLLLFLLSPLCRRARAVRNSIHSLPFPIRLPIRIPIRPSSRQHGHSLRARIRETHDPRLHEAPVHHPARHAPDPVRADEHVAHRARPVREAQRQLPRRRVFAVMSVSVARRVSWVWIVGVRARGVGRWVGRCGRRRGFARI